MLAGQQFRRGLKKAMKITGTSARQVSVKAGKNQEQVNRFMAGADIKLKTLDDICRDGLGMSFNTVWWMGD